MNLQFPITNEEALKMGYSLAEMNAAHCHLRALWLLVEREARRNRQCRNT